MMNRQNVQTPPFIPGYYQPQQQVYGGYPAAPSPFTSNNQLYNPVYPTNQNVNNNRTLNAQVNNVPVNMPNGYVGGSTYVSGPQSCISMTGERITVQSLPGTKPESM